MNEQSKHAQNTVSFRSGCSQFTSAPTVMSFCITDDCIAACLHLSSHSNGRAAFTSAGLRHDLSCGTESAKIPLMCTRMSLTGSKCQHSAAWSEAAPKLSSLRISQKSFWYSPSRMTCMQSTRLRVPAGVLNSKSSNAISAWGLLSLAVLLMASTDFITDGLMLSSKAAFAQADSSMRTVSASSTLIVS